MSEPTFFIDPVPEKPFEVLKRIEELEKWVQKIENEERVGLFDLIGRVDNLERKILILEQEVAALAVAFKRLGPIIGHRERGAIIRQKLREIERSGDE